MVYLNKIIKRMNWYKNIIIYTTPVVSNVGYRDNLQRNYEIVNLGSNPGRFAFFYEDVLGQNWSTGTQGLTEDLEIVKYYFSYIKKSGVILLPIVPFTSISPYLKYKPDYTPITYYAKYIKVLDWHQITQAPSYKKALRFIRYPLFFNLKYIRYLLKDTDKDNRLLISEQTMQPLELNADADKWINGWKKEFDIKDLSVPVTNVYKECIDESVKQLQQIITFCLERELKPVLIIPPVTKYLSEYFTPEVREQYIYSFIRQANTMDVQFLDYFSDERFQDSELYFNSFFLNLRGRKLFTRQVLRDLGLSE
jgi:hypothetical protein